MYTARHRGPHHDRRHGARHARAGRAHCRCAVRDKTPGVGFLHGNGAWNGGLVPRHTTNRFHWFLSFRFHWWRCSEQGRGMGKFYPHTDCDLYAGDNYYDNFPLSRLPRLRTRPRFGPTVLR